MAFLDSFIEIVHQFTKVALNTYNAQQLTIATLYKLICYESIFDRVHKQTLY